MKRIVFILLILLVTLPVYALDPQPFSFNGIKFGIPIEAQGEGIIFEKLGYSGKYTVSGLPDIGIEREYIIVDTVDGKIESMSMSFASKDSSEFLEMISGKYGKPSIMDESKIQTMRGLQLTRIFAKWVPAGMNVVLISRTSSDVTKAIVMVETVAYTKNREERQKKEKQKAKGNL
jgi:hypothetical protein